MISSSERKALQARRHRRQLRVRALLHGTAARPRLVVVRTLKHIAAQLVDDDAGRTLVSARDTELKAKKGTPAERANAVGGLLAEKAKKAGIESILFDRRQHKYHGRVKALADGARAGGLTF